MNRGIISALVSKDATLYFRNRFFAFVSILALVFYVIIYFVMPSVVDEDLEIAFYAMVVPPVFEQTENGLVFEQFETEDALKEAITNGDYAAGISLPADIMDKLTAGQQAEVDVFYNSLIDTDIQDTINQIITELAFIQAGQPLTIGISEEILGTDMTGQQIPQRDRLLPLLAVAILMMETLGLASLISDEVENRTVRALLVTPMSVTGFFTAKGITGITLAFVQVLIFMAIVGGLSTQPLIILAALLLGSVLATGIGFLVASGGKDLLSVMAWGIPAMIVLIIPAFVVMFPGPVSDWVMIIPSYYLVDTVHLVANLGGGWGDIWQNLLILLGFDALIIWLGIIVLRRKLQ